VKLLSNDSFREETFNDLVNRQIHDDDSQSEQQLEHLEVIRSFKQIKGENTVKRKDEYIDMGKLDKMKDYVQYKKGKAL